MKTFCLITNVSNMKYWSCRVSRSSDPIYRQMIKKYGGPIYVNDMGGWFDTKAVRTIHKTVKARKFSVDID